MLMIACPFRFAFLMADIWPAATIRVIAVLAIAAAFCSPVRADVVYSNLGPGDSFSVDTLYNVEGLGL
jgi:hypothetical protein